MAKATALVAQSLPTNATAVSPTLVTTSSAPDPRVQKHKANDALMDVDGLGATPEASEPSTNDVRNADALGAQHRYAVFWCKVGDRETKCILYFMNWCWSSVG